MDEIQKELQQEEELLKVSKEEEVRAKVIEKYGLDELEHESLIDNLVKDRLEDQKRFGELVGQKRKHREAAAAATKAAAQTPAVDPDEIQKKTAEVIDQRLEQRDLESLELPDEIKAEVQKLAKAQGISVRKAATDPYIKFKKDAWEKEQQETEAAISRNNKTAATTAFDPEKPPRLDPSLNYSTPDGKKALEKFQKDMDAWTKKAQGQ
jgi:hypothetical protein